MKNIIVMVFFLPVISGCAGMDLQHQRNMATNAAVWGGIGAASSAAVAAVTGGEPGKVAVLGGLAGAALGAANTPRARVYESTPGHLVVSPSLMSPRDRAYRQEMIRLRERAVREYVWSEEAMGRQEAREDFYRVW